MKFHLTSSFDIFVTISFTQNCTPTQASNVLEFDTDYVIVGRHFLLVVHLPVDESSLEHQKTIPRISDVSLHNFIKLSIQKVYMGKEDHSYDARTTMLGVDGIFQRSRAVVFSRNSENVPLQRPFLRNRVAQESGCNFVFTRPATSFPSATSRNC